MSGVILELFYESDYVKCGYSEEVETGISQEEWAEMSDDERDQVGDQMVEEWLPNHISAGWRLP